MLYSAPLKVNVRLTNLEKQEVVEQEVLWATYH